MSVKGRAGIPLHYMLRRALALVAMLQSLPIGLLFRCLGAKTISQRDSDRWKRHKHAQSTTPASVC